MAALIIPRRRRSRMQMEVKDGKGADAGWGRLNSGAV